MAFDELGYGRRGGKRRPAPLHRSLEPALHQFPWVLLEDDPIELGGARWNVQLARLSEDQKRRANASRSRQCITRPSLEKCLHDL